MKYIITLISLVCALGAIQGCNSGDKSINIDQYIKNTLPNPANYKRVTLTDGSEVNIRGSKQTMCYIEYAYTDKTGNIAPFKGFVYLDSLNKVLHVDPN